MSDHFRFTTMNLIRSPGFDAPPFGVIDSFSKGLNIITGPNGVGKSSLIRAMAALLHSRSIHTKVEARAELATDTHSWDLNLSGGQLLQQDSSSGEPSNLPGRVDELSDSYFFDLHALLVDVLDSSVFLERVNQEMQGGIDLDKALADSGFLTTFITKSFGLARQEVKARRALREIKAEISAQENLSDQIAALREEVEKGESLRREQKWIEEALLYHDRRQTIDHLEEKLEKELDTRLAFFSDSTLEDLEKIQTEVTEATDDEKKASDVLEKARAAVESLAVDPTLIDDPESVEKLNHQIDQVQAALATVNTAKERYEGEQKAFESMTGQLSWMLKDAVKDHPNLDELVESLGDLAASSERVRTTLSAHQQIVDELGSIDIEAADKVREVEQALEIILSHLTKSSASYERWPLILASVLMIFSALLTFLWRGSALIGAVVSSVVILAFGLNTQKRIESDALKDLLDAEGLESADPASLIRLFERLVRRLAELQSRTEHAKRIKNAQAKLDVAKKSYQEWKTEHLGAARALNLNEVAALESAPFFHAADHLKNWLKRRDTLAKSVAALEHAQSEYRKRSDELASICGDWNATKSDLIARARDLVSAINTVRAQITTYEGRADALQQAKVRRARATTKKARFYQYLDVEIDDEQTVEQLAAQYKTWKDTTENLQVANQLIKAIAKEGRELAETYDQGALTLRKEELERQISILEEKSEKIGEFKHKYDNLTKSTELQERDFAWRLSIEALEDHRQEAVKKRMIYALAERIKQESQRQSQPEVISQASSWLQKITHARYSLEVRGGSFVAYDHTTQRPYQITELSSGTKVQLLFAIRMGFLYFIEKGGRYRFPLFFDELLANSDDERSIAVAEVIGEIAKSRQVFYVTAQSDEVVKLSKLVGVDATVIDLGELTQHSKREQRPFTEVTITLPKIPVPVDNYNEYAKELGISSPDRFLPVGGAHSWYLCTNSEELHSLLVRGLVTVGQASTAGAPWTRRSTLLERAQKLAQRGRARGVAAYDLDDLPSQVSRSAQYFEEIIDFLSEEERTGNDLIEAIEERQIKRLSESVRESLRSWLYERGFATDDAPYSNEEILSRIAVEEPDLTVDSDDYLVIQRFVSSL